MDHLLLDKLENYARLEHSEIGDYVMSLISVARFSEPHGMTEQFRQAVQQEVLHWVNRFETETEIVTYMQPQPDIRVQELEWL